MRLRCAGDCPRFRTHFTPTYSFWINQVERFFAYVPADLLQRSDQALEADIRKWVKGWNEDPKPFIWTKPAEQILESLSRLLQRTPGAGHSEDRGPVQPVSPARLDRSGQPGELRTARLTPDRGRPKSRITCVHRTGQGHPPSISCIV